MSLSATLANALSGLNVAQQALSVTANNVANANTPGYSRKILNQETVVVGDRGAGVRSTDIARITDAFLTKEIRRQSSIFGRSDAALRYQDLLQLAFSAPGDNRDIAVRIGGLQVALYALANNPEAPATAAPGAERDRRALADARRSRRPGPGAARRGGSGDRPHGRRDQHRGPVGARAQRRDRSASRTSARSTRSCSTGAMS